MLLLADLRLSLMLGSAVHLELPCSASSCQARDSEALLQLRSTRPKHVRLAGLKAFLFWVFLSLCSVS